MINTAAKLTFAIAAVAFGTSIGYGIAVGDSSRDLPLRETVSLGGASCPGAAASIPLVTQLRSGKTACLSRRTG